MTHRGLSAVLVAALVACAPDRAALPQAPLRAGPAITVRAEPAPLNPADPAQDRVANFIFAGALALTSDQTARLHGLSDLAVDSEGRLTAVSDEGDLFTAKLQMDASGRLAGLTDAQLTALSAQDGQPLQGKAESDSEGLAILSGGDRLVSFERHHRIWLYPAAGGPPRPAPTPAGPFPDNSGLEALAALPAVGADAYVAGAEDSGQTWICRLSAGCEPGYAVALPPQAGLTAASALPDGRIAWLARAWDPLSGTRVTLTIRDAAGAEIDGMSLAPPLTVDNFEGLAAVARRDGGVRFYLISDDNFSARQRTLLVAFDWTPKSEEAPK